MSHTSTSDPSSRNQPSTASREANIDKFATLFTPGTPRASPDLGFTPLPEMRFSDAHRQASHRRVASDSSQQSEFGAFVAVSAFDDPLSADIIEEAGLQAPMVATPTTATPTIASYPKDAQDTKPSSLSFFDQFAQDAKQRSTSRRSVVLEELLKHEDDPLYFLKEETSKPTTPIPPDATPALMTAFSHDHDFDIHQELDPDYFRSSSFHVPVPKLASPLASVAAIRSPEERTSPAPLDPDETLPGAVDDKNLDSSGDSESIISSQLAKSTSYQSLSEIPPRWMSTLLRGGHSPGSATVKPVLESIFGDHSSPSSSPTAHASLSHTHSRAASTPSQSRRAFPRSQTSPIPSSPSPVFTHTSAFAPPPTSTSSTTLSHGASPFASHTYIPPTGAPGFKGELYTWDKGFSEELEAEREQEQERGEANVKSQTVLDPSPVQTTREGEKEQAVPVSSPLAIKGRGGGRWGSGFGFGFGSMRGSGNGKAKLVADARDVVSPSGSSTLNDGNAGSAVRRASPGRSTGSGSASSSRSRLEDEGLGGDHGRKLSNLTNPDSDHNLRGRQVGMGEFIEKITGDVKLLGRKAATTPVLTPDLAGRIRPHLPALSRLSKSWSLIYSLDQDGISLNTLYKRCEAHAVYKPGPGEIARNNSAMLVVIKDANGAVFGVWLAEGIRLTKGSKGYFGGGESFLWKYTELTFKVFKCTGRNNYVAFCEPEYISFGGGDGHYGLYLDDALFEGSSAPCPTFDNEPLCSPGPKKGLTVEFECVGVEVWAMGP